MSALLGGGGSGSGPTLPGRIQLLPPGPYIYYVNAATGNDTTGDGSIGSPWATIQHGANYLMYEVTAQDVAVKLKVVDGTYAENLVLGPHQCFGPVSTNFNGITIEFSSTSTPTNVVLAPPAPLSFDEYAVILAAGGGNWCLVGGFSITSAGAVGVGVGLGIAAITGSLIHLHQFALVFNDATPCAFDCEFDAEITIGEVAGAAIHFVSTCGCLVLTDTGANVMIYENTNIQFDVDPLFGSTLGGFFSFPLGMFELGFGGDVTVDCRATYSGASCAAPPQGRIVDGNCLIDRNGYLPATAYTIDARGSHYNGDFSKLVGTLNSLPLPLLDSNQSALQGIASTNDWAITAIVYGTAGTASNGPAVAFAKTRGGDPTVQVAVQSGDELAAFYAYGSDGSVYRNPAFFHAVVESAVSANDIPTGWAFVTGHSLPSQVEALFLSSDQVVCIGPGRNTGLSQISPAVVGVGGGTQGDSTGTVSLATVTSPATELILEQTGDTFGTTRLHLQNRGGANGALFENVTLDLVDFVFLTSTAATANARFEHRNVNQLDPANTLGEFQTILGPFNGVYLAVGDASICTSSPQFVFGAPVNGPQPAIRVSAALLQARFSDNSAYVEFEADTLRPNVYTVGTLPTPGTIGRMAAVSDGDALQLWGATVVNSGAGTTPYLVWDNGSNWTVFGK